jgi:hypothetical protein
MHRVLNVDHLNKFLEAKVNGLCSLSCIASGRPPTLLQKAGSAFGRLALIVLQRAHLGTTATMAHRGVTNS